MNSVNRPSSPSSHRGFRPTSTAPDAPAPTSSRWFVDRPGGLQSMLQDVFGNQSSRIIEDLYAFQQKLRAMPTVGGQKPEFTFLNTLVFSGEEGNRQVQLSGEADGKIPEGYQKMVEHLQEILNSPKLEAVTKAIASKNEAQHLRNKGILLCLLIGIIVTTCFLGGCFMVPLPVYILLGASALGAAGMQLWYTFQERSCTAVAQTELGRLLGEMNQQVADAFSINSEMAAYFKVDQTYFKTLSPEYSAFKFKLLALWQSLFRSGLLEQSNLHYAVCYGDEATVNRLLEAGNIDVNAKNDSIVGCTPLCWAAKYNNLSMCTLLLKSGADVNAQLHAFHNTALHEAAKAGYKDICELLLQHGAQINAKNIFTETALHQAAKAGHADICKFLLDNGANVNAKALSGITALQTAVEEGHAEVCALLLKNKAVVGDLIYDAIIMYTTCITDFGQRAGIDRKAIDAKAICLLLLRHGADVNIRDVDGNTPLTYIFRKQMRSDFPQYLMPKYKDLFLLLLQAGADVNHIFEMNKTQEWDSVKLKQRIQQLATPLLLEKATASGDPMDNRQIPTEVIEDIIAPFLI